MNSRTSKTKFGLKAFFKTFILFFIPMVLITLGVFIFLPYFQNRSIATGCERLFEQRALDFFRKGGLSSYINTGDDSTLVNFLSEREFEIMCIYVWDGHWIALYSREDFIHPDFRPSEIGNNFIEKHNILFWKGNSGAIESDPPLFHAAEYRGGKLYLMTARLDSEYVDFIEIIPKKYNVNDIILLFSLSLLLSLGATFLLAALVQGYSIRIRRSSTMAEFHPPSAPFIGLDELGHFALDSARNAYETRQQKRNILLQQESEFESERRDFSIVREIAQTTVAATNLTNAADKALIPLVRRTGVRCGAIYRIHGNDELKMIGEHNLPADLAVVLAEPDSEVQNLKKPVSSDKIEIIPIQLIPGARGNPILSLKEEGLTHTLCITLDVKGEMWGVIHLYNAGPIKIDNRLNSLLLATADEIALILENKRVLTELDGRIKESLAYYEFSKTLISINDFDMLLENILWLIHEILEVPFCSVLLVNEEEETLDVKAIWGYGKEHEKMRLKFGEGLIGWTAKHGEAALVKDVSADPRYYEGFSWVTSELAVPLIADGKVIGVLDCESDETHQLDESDLRFLSAVAEPIALAIQRAMRYTEMSRQLVLDPVTNLYNRRYFDNLIEKNGEELLLRHGKVSVAFINVSNLGEINNSYGYLAGDLIVKQVAKMLKGMFTEGIISRYGQSEFLILLPGIGEEAMLRMVEELRELREKWLEKHPDSIPITFSQGYATTDRYDELRNLINRADSQAVKDRMQNNGHGNNGLLG